jgi:hypothetical protein
LLVKYGLTIEDLSDDIKKVRVFKVKTDNDKAVFLMCCFKIIGADETAKAYSLEGFADEYCIELTDYEYAELSQLYGFHKKNINREFKKMKADFQKAYQYKHNLYSSKERATDARKEITGEDMMRMFKYASEMDDVLFQKTIENQ